MDDHDAVIMAEAAERVRRWWLPTVNRRCQEFVGILTSASKALEISELEAFLTALPVPKGPVEEVVMKGILLDLLLRIARADDVDPPRGPRMTSHGTMPRAAAGLRIQPGWSDECAGVWAVALAEVASDFAVRSAGLRATGMMRARYTQRWPLSRLARETSSSPHELAVSVRKQFGVTPRQYLERVRLDQAIVRLRRGDKIEFIPGEVGYGSRKNMNGAFKRVVGLHPSQVRRLSDKDIEMVKQRIAHCLRPIRGTPDRIDGGTHAEESNADLGAPSGDSTWSHD